MGKATDKAAAGAMGGGLKGTLGAVIAVGCLAPAIVAFWLVQSSLPSRPAPEAPVPPESLPLAWHDPPRALPELRFADAEGGDVTLADFRGRLVLLNLWATWCPPCIRELPSLDRLQARFGGPDFTVLALSQDRAGLDDVGPFWERAGLTHLDIYLDRAMAAGRALEARGLPTTLLIDRDGRELARLEGPAEWDAPEAMAYFAALIGGR